MDKRITRANMVRSCLIISWAISHFGIKPVNGGKPLKERRARRERVDKVGDLDHAVDIS